MNMFDFYTDAGHGWLKVHVYEVSEAGLTPGDFTAFSYQLGDHVYLEEDCDAGRFIQAWEKLGREFKFRSIDHGYNSPIRSYPRIVPEAQHDDILF